MSGWFKGFTTTRTRVSPDMSSSSQLPQLFVTITVSQTGIKETKKRVFLTAAVMFFFLFGVYIWEEKKTPRWRSTNRSRGPYPYFQGHNPPPPPTSLTPSARDAHPVPISFPLPCGQEMAAVHGYRNSGELAGSDLTAAPATRKQNSPNGVCVVVGGWGGGGGVTLQRHIYKCVHKPQTTCDFPYSCWHGNHNTGNKCEQRDAHTTQSS